MKDLVFLEKCRLTGDLNVFKGERCFSNSNDVWSAKELIAYGAAT
jgi:hypothetical protein